MNTLKAGYAKIDITPPEGVELNGYGYFMERRNTGVRDRIYARAVALDDGAVRYLLINCDMTGVPSYGLQQTEHALSVRLGLAREHIMLACIHTHSAPAVGVLNGCGEPDEAYARWFYTQVIEAGVRAFDALRPVQAARIFEKAVDSIGFNRAVPDGPHDPTVRGLLLEREGERPLLLANHGCHPVSAGRNLEVSADFPGYAVQSLDAEGIELVMLVGFCGDINPRLKETPDAPVENGKILAGQLADALKTADTLTDISLRAAGFDLEIGLHILSNAEIEEQAQAFSKHGPAATRAIGTWSYLAKQRNMGSGTPYDTVHVRFLRIGQLVIAGYSAEMTTALADIIKEAFPGQLVFHMGNLFDTRRYIASKDIVERNAYEGLSSTYAYATVPIIPGEGERMVTESVRRAAALL